MKFRNVSSLGDLYVLGRTVFSGEVIEVSADEAVSLSAQPGNWEPVTKKGAGE